MVPKWQRFTTLQSAVHSRTTSLVTIQNIPAEQQIFPLQQSNIWLHMTCFLHVLIQKTHTQTHQWALIWRHVSSRRINAVHCQSLLIRCPLRLDHNPLSLSFHKNTHREIEPHTVLALHVLFINTHCHHHAAMERPHIQHLQSEPFQNYTHPHKATSEALDPCIYIQSHKTKHMDHTMHCIFSAYMHSLMCTFMYICVCPPVKESMPASCFSKQLYMQITTKLLMSRE